MIVYPAIDLLDGACVRLRQGDYAQVTTFSVDPLEIARSFREQGARALHVVDLDGAKRGAPVHARLIGEYLAEGNSPDQPGRFVVWLYPRVPVYGFRFPGEWLDIGNREQLLDADNRMRVREGLPPRDEYSLG